ncbi:FAD-dependent oxidoreductase [Govanella unica]|uniref:FAD-dependent oxidoreductase n=1 Tax=Govanella unica TaxID=2975056 RepID=A0A9X3Z899_9PROT|nr:FAD-dependent oxidoreductase [Govania unica]MDA5194809.1 FAD-dependent oxidoreductase [Govania unica]
MKTYPFVAPPELVTGEVKHIPVIIAGAGPVGLSMAIDLRLRGVDCLLLDDDDRVSHGSRAICYAKRTLEIWDRLGCGDRMVEKGVRWDTGRIFFGDGKEPVYSFDLRDEDGHKYPSFINLQQYYAEEFLLDRLAELGQTPRWKSKVTAVTQTAERAEITVDTPDGSYRLTSDYVIAADGARSPVRHMLGLEFEGRIFEDHFLIADIKMKGDFPAERWFWFDPPFNRGQSALLHRQPDDVWRLDFQLGWDIDREAELDPLRIDTRIRAMMGADVDYKLEWSSIYTFQCRRLDRFVHGRVIFAGDSAHLVSPFGARGANSGVQDVDNLGWKLALILNGRAPVQLLESYNSERVYAARENLLNSTRATDFITPKSDISRLFRNAVLELAASCPFAQRMVNSGRLSVPAHLRESALNSPDKEDFSGVLQPGSVAADGHVIAAGQDQWFLSLIGQETRDFVLLHFADPDAPAPDISPLLEGNNPIAVYMVGPDLTGARRLADPEGHLARRYDARPGTTYLLRPDHHVSARWRSFDATLVRAAQDRALNPGTAQNSEEAA